MAFATVADLEARWGKELSQAEEAQASVLLEDAAAILTALVRCIDPDNETQEANLRQVSCNMVKRAMSSAASSAFGIDQATATMGPFSQRVEYANPSGDLYVTKAERAVLGIGSAQIGTIRANARQVTIHHAHR